MCKRLPHGGTTANHIFSQQAGKVSVSKLETSLSRLHRIEKSQLFAKFLNIFPPQVGEKPASPILELLYYGFVELSNRSDGENLQLNIVLYQGSLFRTLYFCVTKSGDVSIIISKFERKY